MGKGLESERRDKGILHSYLQLHLLQQPANARAMKKRKMDGVGVVEEKEEEDEKNSVFEVVQLVVVVVVVVVGGGVDDGGGGGEVIEMKDG